MQRVRRYPWISRQRDDACAKAIWNRVLSRMFSLSGVNNKGGVMSLEADDVSNDSAENPPVRTDRQNEFIDVFLLLKLKPDQKRDLKSQETIYG